MLRFFGTLYALLVILGGTLRYFPTFPPERSLWILQLVVSELGLLLAFPLAALTLYAAKARPRFSVLSILAPVSLFVALMPVLETIAQERNWIWDLQYGPGRDQKPMSAMSSPYIGEITRPLFLVSDFFALPVRPLAVEEIVETPDGARLPLFFYPAPNPSGKPMPWVLSIHGGGWSGGSPKDLDQTIPALLKAGYSVVAPSYRFAPTHRWPRQMEDVEAAYLHVMKKADALKLDPNQFWILGRSAGGQIALKIAYSSKVVGKARGVMALYTPTDLDFGYRWSFDEDVLNSKKMLSELIGNTPAFAPEKYLAASPLADVTPASPPTLLLTGRPDPLVWYRHADRLSDRLKKNGVRVLHIELPWATHGFDYFPNSPGGQIARNVVLRFMEFP
jgi:acetyl esterase/lipase